MLTSVRLYCFLAFWGTFAVSFGQTPYAPFQHIQLGAGLDINCVTDMEEGPEGFLWFSSWMGLYRYDGNTFKGYSVVLREDSFRNAACMEIFRDSKDRLWAATNLFTCIYSPEKDSLIPFGPPMVYGAHAKYNSLFLEDPEGYIWRTSQRGLQKILPDQGVEDTFPIIHYQHIPEDSTSLPHAVVNSLILDDLNRLWLGTDTGLCQYLPKEDIFLPHPAFDKQVVIAMAKSSQNELYVGTLGAGLFRFDLQRDAVQQFIPQEGMPGHLQGKEIRKISIDHAGRVWLLTSDKQVQRFWLECFDPETGLFRQYESPFFCTLMPDIISAQIHCDKQGRIWLAQEKGIYRYLETEDRFEKMEGVGLSPQEQGWVDFWYEDQQGLMWLGFLKHGLFKYAPSRNKFQYLLHDPQNPNSISTNEQAFVFVDSKGWIWLTPQRGRVEKIKLDEKYRVIAKQEFPWYGRICGETPQGNLWVLAPPGARLFDPESERFIQDFHFDKKDTLGLSDSRVGEVKNGIDGDIWISTYGGGLNRFDPKTQTYRHYFHNPEDSTSLAFNLAGPMVYDFDDNLWIGTFRGLSRYNAETDNFTNYLRGVQLGGHYLHPDSSFWISSGNFGLFNVHTRTGKVQRFTSQNSGIPTNRLNTLLFDDNQNLWIASDKGLIYFDVERQRFRLFDEADGLQSTQFYIFHSRKLASGEMLFPLLDRGILIFHPDSMLDKLPGPRLKLVNFDLLNQDKGERWEKAKLQESLTSGKGLSLAYNQDAIALDFVGLQFDAPEKQIYAFSLEGLDDARWVEVGNQGRITFPSLASRSYTLHVKAQNFEGTWGPVFSLPIKIRRPWYANGGAFALYLALAAGIIWALYRNQKRRWRLQADLKLEQHEALRLQELDHFKNRLYTNITHEFRTPLTVILGVADDLGRKPASWLAKGKQTIRRNAKTLLQLVQQMLDLSKLESGAISANMVQGDIVPYLKYLLESLHSMAVNRGLQLDFQSDIPELVMDYDPEKLESIATNLLSNAIKFTPRGGRVSLQLAVESKPQAVDGGQSEKPEVPTANSKLPTNLLLSVTDTGVGIPQKDLKYIFDRFYQVEGDIQRAVGGTGIGLALTQELVHFLGGEIVVESQEGKGTTFTISLPIRRIAEKTTPDALQEMEEEAFSLLPEEVLAMEEKLQNGLPHLLIVEDNVDVLDYLKSILGRDYHIVSAEDGEMGWEKALEFTPDLIISDVMMPKMDGFQLCEKLKTDMRTSHIPIILLTAKADQASRISGLEHGADAYLEKPFDKGELFARMDQLLALRRALILRYGQPEQFPSPLPKLAREDKFVQQVRKIMEENLHQEAFLLETIWQELGMSRPQFYRKFKAVTDLTPADYLLALRMQKGYELLLQGKLRVAEVAFQVGFRNAGHFSKKFIQHYGKAPSSIRNNGS